GDVPVVGGQVLGQRHVGGGDGVHLDAEVAQRADHAPVRRHDGPGGDGHVDGASLRGGDGDGLAAGGAGLAGVRGAVSATGGEREGGGQAEGRQVGVAQAHVLVLRCWGSGGQCRGRPAAPGG